MPLLFIDWDVDPVIFRIGGFGIRYYSILFALAFWVGYLITAKMFKREGAPDDWVDKLFIYTIISTIIGARLGHVLFYGWDFYSKHPIEIFKIWEGGLASHGSAIGILTGLYIYHRRVSKRSYLWVLDHIVVPIAFAAFCIRMGNLFNSEICGKPTDVPWAFRFLRLHPDEALIPRHPTQIYEAVFYLATFAFMCWLYMKRDFINREGGLFAVFLLCIFGYRIMIETLKENQEAWEEGMALNMGQLLSIPFVLAGAYFLWKALTNPPKENLPKK